MKSLLSPNGVEWSGGVYVTWVKIILLKFAGEDVIDVDHGLRRESRTTDRETLKPKALVSPY